jgi:hypothetical protein
VCCFNSFVKFSLLVSREPKSVDVSHSFFLLLQIAPSTTIHTLRHAWPRLSSERSSVFHSLAPSILNFFYFFFFCSLSPCTRTVWATVSAYRKSRQLLLRQTVDRPRTLPSSRLRHTYVYLIEGGRAHKHQFDLSCTTATRPMHCTCMLLAWNN